MKFFSFDLRLGILLLWGNVEQMNDFEENIFSLKREKWPFFQYYIVYFYSEEEHIFVSQKLQNNLFLYDEFIKMQSKKRQTINIYNY